MRRITGLDYTSSLCFLWPGEVTLGYRRHMRRHRRLILTLAAAVCVAGIAITAAHAQQIWAGGYGRMPPRFPSPTTFSGGFNFCRLMFTSDHREKQGWSTDYPGADINFSIRVGELTKVTVTMREDSEVPEPDAVVVRATDDALFNCPFTVASDVGTVGGNEEESARVSVYLPKGGLLGVDDVGGTQAWRQWSTEIAKGFPLTE